MRVRQWFMREVRYRTRPEFVIERVRSARSNELLRSHVIVAQMTLFEFWTTLHWFFSGHPNGRVVHFRQTINCILMWIATVTRARCIAAECSSSLGIRVTVNMKATGQWKSMITSWNLNSSRSFFSAGLEFNRITSTYINEGYSNWSFTFTPNSYSIRTCSLVVSDSKSNQHLTAVYDLRHLIRGSMLNFGLRSTNGQAEMCP